MFLLPCKVKNHVVKNIDIIGYDISLNATGNKCRKRFFIVKTPKC